MAQADDDGADNSWSSADAAAGERDRDGAALRGDGFRWRNFYGRRKGKALRPAQVRNLEEILPRLEVPHPVGSAEKRLSPEAWFSDPEDVWLEIGFGAGEHLHQVALRHPEVGLVGCEPFVNGVAALVGKIAERDPGNIRVHPGDARYLLDRVPEATFGRVYLLYPDPWPKARHRGRRFVVPETLVPLARAMKPRAELRLATDIPDYAEHAVASMRETGLFRDVVVGAPLWHMPWEGWSATRYETKALREGRPPHYLIWQRL